MKFTTKLIKRLTSEEIGDLVDSQEIYTIDLEQHRSFIAKNNGIVCRLAKKAKVDPFDLQEWIANEDNRNYLLKKVFGN